jgi:RimJ/RimL family protein N-acetyltransferase
VKTRPLYAHVVKHNIGSRRVLEKCGFKVIREEPEEFILKLSGQEEESQ